MPGAPIVALATAPGEAAIAVLRISGEGSFALVDRIFCGRQPVRDLPPRAAAFGKIVDAEEGMIDEVLVTPFHGPASYTGEDLVEIACHGGRLVSGLILQGLLAAGGRLADPGEFTQRAFLNGKMDLTQAEAVMDLITAKTPLALRAATEQLEGQLGRQTQALADSLLDLVAHLEAWIDFPEEDINPDTEAVFLQQVEKALNGIVRLLATADEGRILREGVRLAIGGLPNAGKSSLLNRLLGFERAIVSEHPGTTRDTIEEFINLGGVPFRIIDTAGLRESECVLEQAGMARTRQAIAGADVILEVVDARDPQRGDFAAEQPRLLVWNKMDLPGAQLPPSGAAGISCLTGEGLDGLVRELTALAGHHLPEGNQTLLAINRRHQACLQRAMVHLQEVKKGLVARLEPELLALDLRGALEALCEITGRLDIEDLLGRIFQLFCIGK